MNSIFIIPHLIISQKKFDPFKRTIMIALKNAIFKRIIYLLLSLKIGDQYVYYL